MTSAAARRIINPLGLGTRELLRVVGVDSQRSYEKCRQPLPAGVHRRGGEDESPPVHAGGPFRTMPEDSTLLTLHAGDYE